MIFILKNSCYYVSALKEGKHEEIFNIAKHFINTVRFLISRVISMEYFYRKYGYGYVDFYEINDCVFSRMKIVDEDGKN